jgi:hypothetical protein
MKKISTLSISIFVWGLMMISPVLAFAQKKTLADFNLFPCDGPKCTFKDLITVANGIINALFFAVIIISPVLIAIAGYRYIISSDQPAERTKANGQLKSLVIGLVIIACAYAIVSLVLKVLIDQSNLSVTF